MNKRSGPFWDGIEGRAPVPPAAATLGLEVIAADSERDTIELAFAAREDFTNPAGNVLGSGTSAHAQTMFRTYRDEAQERLATRTTMYREMP